MAKKKAASKKVAARNATPVTKTAAIRTALKASKDGSPTEVARVLNKQGVKVTAAYVSTIKASDKRKADMGKPLRKPGRPVGSGKSSIAASADMKQAGELLLKAVDLVLRAGAKEAKELVSMAEQMVDKIGVDS